jgi:hypothetical protein
LTPDEFLIILRTSLEQVGSDYYGKDYFSEDKLLDAGINQSDQKYAALRDHLKRFGERVFCYELYHQLQCQLQPINNRDDGPILQGELKKDEIGAIVSLMSQGIEPLSKEFIPDFLYHSPANFNHQQVIIEVKTNPKVPFEDLYNDLRKLMEFTIRYSYKLGILLVVNNSGDRIKSLLRRSNKRLCTIQSPEKIWLIVKHNRESPLWESSLKAIII